MVGVQISIVWGMVSKIIGVHVWDLSVVGLQKLSVTTAVDSVLYLAVMALVKFSILHFYLRLSREKWFTYTIYATIAFVFSFSVALMLSLIFACTPLKRVWDVTITEGHCINQGKIYLATAGLNVASDVIILVSRAGRGQEKYRLIVHRSCLYQCYRSYKFGLARRLVL